MLEKCKLSITGFSKLVAAAFRKQVLPQPAQQHPYAQAVPQAGFGYYGAQYHPSSFNAMMPYPPQFTSQNQPSFTASYPSQPAPHNFVGQPQLSQASQPPPKHSVQCRDFANGRCKRSRCEYGQWLNAEQLAAKAAKEKRQL